MLTFFSYRKYHIIFTFFKLSEPTNTAVLPLSEEKIILLFNTVKNEIRSEKLFHIQN